MSYRSGSVVSLVLFSSAISLRAVSGVAFIAGVIHCWPLSVNQRLDIVRRVSYHPRVETLGMQLST
jgi:hypothetical protein